MPARNGAWNGNNWIRRDKRLAIYLRDNFRCVYCGKNLARCAAKLRTLDHVIPVTKNGTNEADNLCTACKKCNDAKGDRTAWEYIVIIAQRRGIDADEMVINLLRLLGTPINRELGKKLLDGTLDLSDLLPKTGAK